MTKILHVAECFEGGVGAAIRTIAERLPEHHHFLLAEGEDIQLASRFETVLPMQGSSFLERANELRNAVHSLQPDVVHLHSSWAGVYGRLRRLPAKVVYEPHCFKFDDPGLNRIARFFVKVAESSLARNHDVLAVLSPHEASLAASISRKPIQLIPNTSSLRAIEFDRLRDRFRQAPRRIAMIGRLCAQKGPDYFLDFCRRLRNIDGGREWNFVWIGDGDPQYRRILEAESVEVTGWLSSEDLIATLDDCFMYFHSASYEGFPIAVLDAAARRLPVIARRIPAFEGSPIHTEDSIDSLAEAAVICSESYPDYVHLIGQSEELIAQMNPERQADALRALYSPSALASIAR